MWLGDALADHQRIDVGRRLLDHGEPGPLEAADEDGLAGARRAGDDVASHDSSASEGARAHVRKLASNVGGIVSAGPRAWLSGMKADYRTACCAATLALRASGRDELQCDAV